MKAKRINFVLFLFFINIGFTYEFSQISEIYQKNVNTNRNLFISSLNNSIILEWNFTWGGNDNEIATDIVLDSLGNIYITGYANYSFIGNFDIILAKFDSSGQIQWNRTFGGDGWDSGYDIALDSNNNIYLAGRIDLSEEPWDSNTDLILVKYNSLGEFQWNKTCGGEGEDTYLGMTLDSVDNIYITGYVSNISDGDYPDLVVFKYNHLGNHLWNRTWGEHGEDYGLDIVLDSSGNIYLTGQSFDESSGANICLLKYNNLGEFQWKKTWNKSIKHEYGTGIALDSSENIYITGITLVDSYPNYDMVFLKYNASGALVWNRTWGKKYFDALLDIAIDSEDNIYLAGIVNYSTAKLYDFCLMQFNINGEQQFNHTWGGIKNDQCRALTIDSSNNIFLAGYTESFGSGYIDIYLAKFSKSADKKESSEIHSYDLSLLILCTILIVGIIIKKKLKH
ncbi:MAG: SBBP repeat-containing protein [Promethearchaeota archaeon]